MEVVILTEIEMLTAKRTIPETKNSHENLERHLDWVDEAKEIVFVQIASYQQRAIAQYNRWIRQRVL